MLDMVKITKRSVDGLSSDKTTPQFLWDDTLTGFGVKVLPSGVKRYILKYRTSGGGRAAPQRWLSLGTHGQLTPDQARGLAQQALASVARGEDPQGAKFKQRAAPSLTDVWTRFESEYLPMRKPQTRSEYESQWRDLLHPKFGRTPVEAIARGDVDKFHKSHRQAPYRANRVLALLSRLMSLAETWDWRAQGTNPCKHIERFPEQARTRFLSVEELRRLGTAIEQLLSEQTILPTAANAVELLLLTGARLNEVLGARWEWVNWEAGVLSLPDSKTGAKPVFLSNVAFDVLRRQKQESGESSYVFSSPLTNRPLVNLRKSWVRICERAGLENVRLHDLRHTAASIAVGRGASLPVIGRLLGHSQAQTTLRYAHVDTDPTLAAANEIGDVVSGAFRHRSEVVGEILQLRSI
jgi:integrase